MCSLLVFRDMLGPGYCADVQAGSVSSPYVLTSFGHWYVSDTVPVGYCACFRQYRNSRQNLSPISQKKSSNFPPVKIEVRHSNLSPGVQKLSNWATLSVCPELHRRRSWRASSTSIPKPFLDYLPLVVHNAMLLSLVEGCSTYNMVKVVADLYIYPFLNSI